MNEEKPNTTLKSWGEIYKGLSAAFSGDALSSYPGPGMKLTSIKAQYIVERLNEIVGLGNWRHVGKYEVIEGIKEVLFMGSIVIYSAEGANEQFGVGSAKLGGKGSTGDAYKSAKTDSLSKCASLFGLGNDVFKGLVKPPTSKGRNKPTVSSSEDF